MSYVSHFFRNIQFKIDISRHHVMRNTKLTHNYVWVVKERAETECQNDETIMLRGTKNYLKYF